MMSNVWEKTIQKHAINASMQAQFDQYLQLLISENQKYNLTAIVDPAMISIDHFTDSLALLDFYDLSSVSRIIDVGCGAGFPSIPLAILKPEITFILLEVSEKKVSFLNMVANQLKLTNIQVVALDWRTFLRKQTEYINNNVEQTLVIARASLQVDELLRMFAPSSHLKKAVLVYWASATWKASAKEAEFFDYAVQYQVGNKIRQLCFFKANSHILKEKGI